MSLSIGIVGLPNVGKSTLFQTITKKQVPRENYPFCTIEPNIGTVEVPDDRVDKLSQLSNSEKKIYATIKFIDIAGLVKGAHNGEGLGNQFLANIREVDAIVYVLRAFKNKDITHLESEADILKNKEILDTEMKLKDLEIVNKLISGLERKIKSGDKKSISELSTLKKIFDFLEKDKNIDELELKIDEKDSLKKHQLLSLKPRIYILNGKADEISQSVLNIFQKNNWRFLIIDLLSQLEVSELSPEERVELGLSADLEIDILIKEAYKLLNLITFFTTGYDETRAWMLKSGSTAPQAGGVIHSDFEKYFIRAEIINWQDLLSIGSFTKAREKGLVRIEGRDYVMSDGDIIEIKSSV